MAVGLFRIGKGLSIDNVINVIYGTADPTSSGVAAPVGSLYCKSDSGNIYHKTGSGNTDWKLLLDSSGSSTEDVYQNNFAGKSGTGNIMPNYTEANHILDNDSLFTAIDKIDMYFGANPTANTRTKNPIVAGNDVNANIEALDDVVGADADLSIVTRTKGPLSLSNSIYANLNALDDVVGADADMTSTNFIGVSQTIYGNLSSLDSNLKNLIFKANASNVDVDPAIAIDSFSVTGRAMVEWNVSIRSNTTPANLTTFKILATTDGTSVDWTQYAELFLGSAVAGLTIDVDINGGNLRLMIGSTETIDYTYSRMTTSW